MTFPIPLLPPLFRCPRKRAKLLPAVLAFVTVAAGGERMAAAQAPQPTQTGRLPSWPAPPPTISTAPAASSTAPAGAPQPLPPLPPPDDASPPTAPSTPPAGDATPVAKATPTTEPDASAQESAPAEEAETTPITPDPWVTSPFTIEAQLGLWAPLGLAGIAIDYAPAPIISFNLGAGLSPFGPQLGLSTRVRVFRFGHRARFAPFVGGGFSLGPHEDGSYDFIDGGGFNADAKWSTAYWANFETGMEMRFGQHTELRPFIGVAALLNPGDGEPVTGSPGSSEPIQKWTCYFGIAVGYATGF
ncbi:MAG TPA: hypothetical protein VH044_13215 [Polyangiaceae bacterium]|jgi:hypothetical protein|nr:hypothetical protein [Polyangiaceae bacterium]